VHPCAVSPPPARARARSPQFFFFNCIHLKGSSLHPRILTQNTKVYLPLVIMWILQARPPASFSLRRQRKWWRGGRGESRTGSWREKRRVSPLAKENQPLFESRQPSIDEPALAADAKGMARLEGWKVGGCTSAHRMGYSGPQIVVQLF